MNISALVVLSDTKIAQDIEAILKKFGASHIDTVECTNDAVNAMLGTPYNLFVVDARVPVTLKGSTVLYGGIDFIRFLRMCQGDISESTVVFLRSKGGLNLIEAHSEFVEARDAGATCVVVQPMTEDKYKAEVMPYLLSPPSFIRALTYTGPDRRHAEKNIKHDRRRS